MKQPPFSIPILLILFMHITGCMAQTSFQKKKPEEKAEFFTRNMKHDLELDDSIALKVYYVNLAVSKKFDSLYAHSKSDETRRGAAIIYNFRNEELRKVLTVKQYLKFEDMERERREKKKKLNSD